MKSKQLTLRMDENLIEMVREMAKAQNRSINNYIETLLMREVGNVPNETTIRAIDDARKGIGEEITNLDKWAENQ